MILDLNIGNCGKTQQARATKQNYFFRPGKKANFWFYNISSPVAHKARTGVRTSTIFAPKNAWFLQKRPKLSMFRRLSCLCVRRESLCYKTKNLLFFQGKKNNFVWWPWLDAFSRNLQFCPNFRSKNTEFDAVS